MSDFKYYASFVAGWIVVVAVVAWSRATLRCKK